MAKESSYFMYFPGNYRWSAAFINMLGSAPYGGSDIGELHKIGQLLKDKDPEDDDAWFDACATVADSVRAHAERFEGAAHRHSAAHAYLRACNYYQMAERFRTPKDDKALAVYRTAVQCFHRCEAHRPRDRNRGGTFRRRQRCPAISCTHVIRGPNARLASFSSTGST